MPVTLAVIFVAGGLGACLRFVVSRWADAAIGATLPQAGTLVVNLVGSLAMGFLGGLVPLGTLRVAVLTGLLGGFTTYSAFALLTVDLGAEGRWGAAAFQVVAHLVGGCLCLVLGVALARLLRGE